jgi:protein SCO1/2
MSRYLIINLTWFLLTCGAAFPQSSLFDKQMQVGFEEKQGQYVALDTKLVNEAGDTVMLRDVLNKPAILNLVYYECPGTCSPLMWGISKFIDAVDLQLGKDYDVLTISFDPSEKIDLGIAKKASYVSTMKKKELAVNWRFFVSDSLNISKLTQSAGFRYQYINNQYIHPTGLIALAADGKITRYMRGIDFLPFDIKITMVEAGKGKTGPSINRLLAICYSYDTKGNQYVFNVTRVSAIVILFIILLIFSYLAFSKVRIKKLTPKNEQSERH